MSIIFESSGYIIYKCTQTDFTHTHIYIYGCIECCILVRFANRDMYVKDSQKIDECECKK